MCRSGGLQLLRPFIRRLVVNQSQGAAASHQLQRQMQQRRQQRAVMRIPASTLVCGSAAGDRKPRVRLCVRRLLHKRAALTSTTAHSAARTSECTAAARTADAEQLLSLD